MNCIIKNAREDDIVNQTIEVIKNRRSIRNYKEEQITEEELKAIVEAGFFAPSANNCQLWHFTVVQNRKLLKELNYETKDVLAKSDNPFLQMVGNNEELDLFNGAPTVIIVSGKGTDENSVIECAAASENMMIAAQSLGVSSCYIITVKYLFDGSEAEYFYDKVGIPKEYKVYNAILLGYNGSDNVPEAAPRKDGCVNYIR